MASIAKNSSFLIFAQLCATALSFLSSILMARLIGPEGMGKWALYNTGLSFAVTFLSFSISITLIYFINNQKYDTNRLVGTIFFYFVAISILLYTVLNIIGRYWSLNILLPQNFQANTHISIFCFMFFNAGISTIFSAIFYAYEKFKLQAFILLLTPLINIVIYALYWFNIIPTLEDPFLLALYANFFTAFINISIIGFGYFKVLKAKISFSPLSKLEIKAIFSASFLTYLATLFQFLSYRMDFWFINYYLNKQELGIYALGTQIAQLLWLFPGAISQVIYSKLASTEDENQIIANLEKTVRISLFLLLPICIFFIIAVYFLLPFVYGTAFSDTIKVIAILIFGILPYTIPIILAIYFLAKGMFKVNTIIGFIGFVISSILYSFLIPRYGIYGAAVSSVFSYLSNCICAIIWLTKINPNFSIQRCLEFNIQEIKYIFGDLIKVKLNFLK